MALEVELRGSTGLLLIAGLRRIVVVAECPEQGPLTEPAADARSRGWELLFLPRSRPSRQQRGSGNQTSQQRHFNLQRLKGAAAVVSACGESDLLAGTWRRRNSRARGAHADPAISVPGSRLPEFKSPLERSAGAAPERGR